MRSSLEKELGGCEGRRYCGQEAMCVSLVCPSFEVCLKSCQSFHSFISSSPLDCLRQLVEIIIYSIKMYIYIYIVFYFDYDHWDFAARFAEHLVASVFLHPEPYDVPSSFLTDQPRPRTGNSVPSAKHIWVQSKVHMWASAEHSCCFSRLIGTEQLCSILTFACVHCIPVRISQKLVTVGHCLPFFVPSSSAAESGTMNGRLRDSAQPYWPKYLFTM